MTYKRWQGPTRPVANGAAVLRLTLEANDDAPGHARVALGRLRGQTDEDVLERAGLLTSELVTNSVKHAGSAEIRVKIWPNAGSVAVVVTDDGPGFAPVAQPGTVSDQDGGFGMPLLDTLSEAWGSGSDGEAWVWFEVSPRVVPQPPPDIGMVVDGVKNHALVARGPAGNVEHRRVHDSNLHLVSELPEQAMTDDLTGLPNRGRWAAELNRELARSRRHRTPLAIVMLDLNGFKAFNDEHGHPAGDNVLRAVARDWSEAVRATDMLARFGGDEFAITLPDCSPELAIAVVGRVRAATPPGIDSSAGIASSDGAETADALVGRADAALYDAKRQGQGVSVAATAP
jgi:diguanylate cyclase (GGDEF)-like protein